MRSIRRGDTWIREARRLRSHVLTSTESSVRRSVWRRRILSLGVVDRHYFGALTGREFRTNAEAVTHYLLNERGYGYSPSPLVEPAFIAVALKGSRASWYANLLRRQGMFPTSPYFDAGTYALTVAGPRRPKTTLEALRHFLTNATPSTQLPVHSSYRGRPPTWGDFLDLALERAERDREYIDALGKRYRDTWAEREELRFLKSVQSYRDRPTGSGAGKVSIITPTRNRLEKLRKAVASVYQQSHHDWQLIIVDDGSVDGTAEYAEKLAAADDRVVYLAQGAQGVSSARNHGLGNVSGEYVAFLDSDNTWRPEYLELSLAGMKMHRVQSVHSGIAMLTTLKNGEQVLYRGEDGSFDHLLVGNFIDLNVLVIRADLLRQVGKFDETLRRWVDYDLLLRIAQIELPRYLPFLGVDYDNRSTPDRISQSNAVGWQDVVLSRYILDWDALEETAGDRDQGLVSIVIPTYRDWQMTARAVRAVLSARGEDERIEVIVIDNGSDRQVSAILNAMFEGEQDVFIHRAIRNLNFALGSNLGASLSRGATIVMLNNDTEVTPGWLSGLVGALDDSSVLGAQPLLLYPDDTIQAAGTVFGGEGNMPWHFLAGHPVEDALRAQQREFSAVTAAALCMRAADFIALRGFDPVFTNGLEDVDLCLRARAARTGTFRVVLDSVVYHHESKSPGRMNASVSNRELLHERWLSSYPDADFWRYESVGFAVPHLRVGAPHRGSRIRTGSPVVIRPKRVAAAGPFSGKPSLRWAIKISSHPGERGKNWGDTFFADDLKRALESVGQEVVVDTRLAHYRSTDYLDDVVLTVRGLDAVVPQPGAVNVLWIISHPELVSDDEIRSYDLVFAASTAWAAETSRRTGVNVLPLLQATNPGRFHPGVGVPGAGDDILFVGSTRDVFRPIVRDAIEHGFEPSVYGPGWEKFIPPSLIKGDSVSRDDLPSMYRTAGTVLADHWDTMAEHGFISNRLFDSVAAGAVVISDEVDGIRELFGGAVATAHDGEELRALLIDPSWRPAEEQLLEESARVREQHSFEARAVELVRQVLAFKGEK